MREQFAFRKDMETKADVYSNVLIVTVKLNLNHLAFSSIGSSIRASQVFASYRGSIIIMEKDGFPAVSRRERAGARFGS